MNSLKRDNPAARVLDFIAVMLASGFFASTLPSKIIQRLKPKTGDYLISQRWTGAGFIGSLWGVVTYLLLPSEIAQSIGVIVLGVLFAVGVSHVAELVLNSHDDSRIVIDEWIGVWIAFWGLEQKVTLPFVVAFILFRVFDVFKGPWGRAAAKLPGGFGVTMDDVVAGVIANLFTRGFIHLIR